MGILADIYSGGNTLKRRMNALIADPKGALGLGATRFGEDQNQLLNLMRNAYPMAGEKTVLNSPQQKAQFRGELADKGAEQAMAAATVWHGSPHKFDKFDSSKIGTGEGAQAYGHGLYLAESPAVAGQYQKELGANIMVNGKPFYDVRGTKLSTTGDNNIDDYILAHHGDMDKAIADALDGGDHEVLPALRALKQKGAVVNQNSGSLYKVDLPDEHIAKMLDLDRTLSSQNPEVLRALGLSDEVAMDWTRGRQTQNLPAEANHFYSQLSETLGSPAKASDFLRQKGIPGNRYLDGGSRGAGTGSSNFVVFPGNESMLSIMERNGQPMNKLSGLLK